MHLHQALADLGAKTLRTDDLLSQTSTLAAIAFDRDLRIVHASGGALARSGNDPSAVAGRPMRDLVPARVWHDVEPRYRRVLAGESVVFELVGTDDQAVYRIHAMPVHGEDDVVVGGVAIGIEITDLVVPLTQEVEDHRMLAQSAAGFTARHLPDGTTREVSGSVRAALGREQVTLLGTRLDDLCHPADAPVLAAARRDALAADEVISARVRLRHADGGWRWFDATLRGHLDDDGRPAGVRAAYRDVTGAEEQQQHLEASERRLREAQLAARVVSWEWEVAEDRITYADNAVEALDLPFDEGSSLRALLRLVVPEDRGLVTDAVARVRAERDTDPFSFVYRIDLGNGDIRSLETRGRALFDADGRLTRAIGTTQDVTARERDAHELWLRAALLDQVGVGVIATDLEGRITHWNRGAEELYGWSGEEAVGRPITELTVGPEDQRIAREIMDALATGGAWEGEFTVRRRDGTTFPALVRDETLRDGDGRAVGIVGVSMDMTAEAEAEQRLEGARDFLAAITDSMAEGLVTLDDAGNITHMNRAAQRQLGWRTADLAGRPAPEALLGRADALDRLRSRDGRPVRDDDATFLRRDGEPLPVAYTSSPFATEDGRRGWVVVFSDITQRKADEAAVQARLEAIGWVDRIRQALEHERFVLYSQPIIDLRTGAQVQEELLIRMVGEDGEIIAPGRFLPAAEEYGIVTAIDVWVVREAARLAGRGRHVQVNVSGHSIADPTFANLVQAEVMVSGAPGRNIVFEVTETALVRDEAAARRFAERVSALGCRLALDDFGTGYSNFAYLKRLPLDVLKIDIEFIRDLEQNPASRHVVRAVVNLARGFGLRTVAEGVEQADTVALLRELGVDFAQGYALGRPRPLPS